MKQVQAVFVTVMMFLVCVFAYSLYYLVGIVHMINPAKGLNATPEQMFQIIYVTSMIRLCQPETQVALVGCCVIGLIVQWLHSLVVEFIEVYRADMEALRRHTDNLGKLGGVELRPGECEVCTYVLMLAENRIVTGIYLVNKNCKKHWVEKCVEKDLMSRTSAWFQFRCHMYSRVNRFPVVSLISSIQDFALDGLETDLAITEKGICRGIVLNGKSPNLGGQAGVSNSR